MFRHGAGSVTAFVQAVLLASCMPEQPENPARSEQPGAGLPVTVELICGTGDADAPCAFRPDRVRVRAGETVRWVNGGATFHTVTVVSSGISAR